MRLLLFPVAAAALTSSPVLPACATYRPTETGDRALSWVAALGVFAKLVKKRPAAAVVAGVLTQSLTAGFARELLRSPQLSDPAALLPDQNSRVVDTDPVEGVRVISYGGPGAVTIHASHGFGLTSESFDDLLPALARRTDVAQALAHDHPGFGLTRRPRQRRKYALSGDVAQALTRNASRVVFVGHSMGAVSAADAAVRAAKAGTRTALVLIAPAIVAGCVGGVWSFSVIDASLDTHAGGGRPVLRRARSDRRSPSRASSARRRGSSRRAGPSGCCCGASCCRRTSGRGASGRPTGRRRGRTRPPSTPTPPATRARPAPRAGSVAS